MPSPSPLRVWKPSARCVLVLALATVTAIGCSRQPKAETKEEQATIARTEFTERIENFFEYEALKPGKPSQFLIHLTDLSDGSPVEKADVRLVIRQKSGAVTVEPVKARVGKVAGIYVADVTVPQAAQYDIEFHVKSAKLDERMRLTDFKAE